MAVTTEINKPSVPLRAYSYLRFSTPEQSKGDSERRQIALARDYAERHGLVFDEELMLADHGVSGRHGQNAVTGALGRFIDEVRRKTVPAGSILLVESLDRLSRDQVLAAQRRFLEMLELGIQIVTLGDNRCYSYESLNENPTELIVSILVMMRAHEESETKSKRLKQSWMAKRNAAEKRKLTKRCPAWLSLKDDRSSFEIIEERAEVIRRMFAMAIEGYGQHAIAQALQADGIPTWGDHGSKRKPAAFWQRSYVKKILTNPAVIGTYVPHVVDYENPEKRKRRRAVEPKERYFPEIVQPEAFARVQDLLDGKTSQPRGRHALTPTQNVLAGLARCPICDGTMTRVSKGSRAKAGAPYLVCTKAKNRAGCDYRAVRMDDVEDALRGFSKQILVEAHPNDLHPELEQHREELREELGVILSGIEELLDEMKSGNKSRAIRESLAALEVKRDDFESRLADVSRKIDRAKGHNLEVRLRTLISALAALTVHRLGKARQVVSGLGKVSKASRAKKQRQRRHIDMPTTSEGHVLGHVMRTDEGKGHDVEAIGRANLALRALLSRVTVNYETGKLLLHWHHMPEPSAVSFGTAAGITEKPRRVVITRPSKPSEAGLDAIELTFLGKDKP